MSSAAHRLLMASIKKTFYNSLVFVSTTFQQLTSDVHLTSAPAQRNSVTVVTYSTFFNTTTPGFTTFFDTGIFTVNGSPTDTRQTSVFIPPSSHQTSQSTTRNSTTVVNYTTFFNTSVFFNTTVSTSYFSAIPLSRFTHW